MLEDAILACKPPSQISPVVCRFHLVVSNLHRCIAADSATCRPCLPAQVVSSINNLIIGKIYVDHGGTMHIVSSASGLACKLRFKEHSRLRNREPHEVPLLISEDATRGSKRPIQCSRPLLPILFCSCASEAAVHLSTCLASSGVQSIP